MDIPTDLSGRPGGSDPDDETARALRAALGAPDGDDGGASRPRTVPPARMRAIERRAGRLHLRRQAVALGGAAAAAAVVIAVGGLVLPQLQSLGGANSASSGSGGSAADSGSAAESAPSATPTPDVGFQDGGGTTLDQRSQSFAASAAAAPLSADSVLSAADVTAFSVPVQDEAPVEETGALTLGACVDGDAGSAQPTTVWRVDLNADARTVTDPPGVVERVARFSTSEEAGAALTAVQSALPACTGPGLEGTGPTTQLDAAAVTPVGGQALVLASTTGQGSPALQVLMASGTTLVQLQVTSDAASADAALSALLPTARTALDRATGGASTLPASGSP